MKNIDVLNKESHQFLAWMIKRNTVVELRSFKDKCTYGGFYDSSSEALKDSQALGGPKGDFKAVYFSLNPFDRKLDKKSHNRIVLHKKGDTVSDAMTTAYRMVMIDFDPIRDCKLSSTREELHYAAGVARRVRIFLKKLGVTTIPAFSGNGFHLLVPVNYADVPDARSKLVLFLRWLKNNYATERVSVDTTVSNPSRICKLYGTYSRKGADTPERPHRRSRLHIRKWMLDLPDQDLFGLTESVIDYTIPVASEDGTELTPEALEQKRSMHINNIRTILAANGNVYREQVKGDRLIFEFEQCPVHTDYDDDTYECCIMVEGDGSYSSKCHHDDTRTWADFKAAINFDTHKPNNNAERIEIYLGGKSEVTKILDTKSVIPVGHDGSKLVFFSMDFNRELSYTPESINLSMLCSDLNYWEAYCPEAFYIDKKGETKFVKGGQDRIKDMLIYDIKQVNRNLQTTQILEAGIYKDNKRTVWNTGSCLIVDGVEHKYFTIPTKNYYRPGNSEVSMVAQSEADTTDFVNLYKVLRRTTLDPKNDCWLFLGAIMAGTLSGLSPWRSHIWICGSPGSGKSVIVDKIISPFVYAIGGDIKFSKVSEAAIRQRIGNKETIYLHDEAEITSGMDGELELIRAASYGAVIDRGTPTGEPLSFKVKTTFILVSVSDSIVNEADKSRFIHFNLKHEKGSDVEWAQLEKDIDSIYTEEMAAKLVRRMVNRADDFLSLCRTTKNIFVEYCNKIGAVGNINRFSDLYSGPMAAFLVCYYDDISTITKESIVELVKSLENTGRFDLLIKKSKENDTTNIAVSLFDKLLDWNISFSDNDGRHKTSRIIDVLNDVTDPEKRCLRGYGIYYLPKLGVVKLKNGNISLQKIFKSLGYINYSKVLVNYPDAKVGEPRKVTGESTFRGVEIPFVANSVDLVAGESPVDSESLDFSKIVP